MSQFLHDNGPVGVFDSGIGGLSILKALRQELPGEDFVYIADNGHAPYGERTPNYVIERSRAITAHLRDRYHVKALVIACNTATAAAIHLLRHAHSDLPIIGVEPALKPAVVLSKTKRIGVMATRGTLASAKFKALHASLHSQAEFICQPCDGLANAIECAERAKTIALCDEYTRAMGQFGHEIGQIDSLVLGCTHYPFARDILVTLLGSSITLIDNGEPVARQVRRLIAPQQRPDRVGSCRFETSGDPEQLRMALVRWLQLDQPVSRLAP